MKEVNEKDLSVLMEEGWVKICDCDMTDFRDRGKFWESMERCDRDEDINENRQYAFMETRKRGVIYANEPDFDDFTDMSFERAPWESDEDYAERMRDLGDFTDCDD